MQNALYQITLLIAGTAVVTTLLEVLIPQGKLKKTVLFAIGLVFLLSIAAPIGGLVNSASTLELFTENNGAHSSVPQATPNYEELLRKYYEQGIEKGG